MSYFGASYPKQRPKSAGSITRHSKLHNQRIDTGYKKFGQKLPSEDKVENKAYMEAKTYIEDKGQNYTTSYINSILGSNSLYYKDSYHSRKPLMDMVEGNGRIHISIDMPGLNVKDISVTLRGNMLHINSENNISSQHSAAAVAAEWPPAPTPGAGPSSLGAAGAPANSMNHLDDEIIYTSERSTNIWSRYVRLPLTANTRLVTATYKNGVLFIQAPVIKCSDIEINVPVIQL